MTKPLEETWEYLSGSYPADVYIQGRSASQGGKVADIWHEEMHEAADLIAAAPELYRALEACLAVLDADAEHCQQPGYGDATVTAAAALKKARGES